MCLCAIDRLMVSSVIRRINLTRSFIDVFAAFSSILVLMLWVLYSIEPRSLIRFLTKINAKKIRAIFHTIEHIASPSPLTCNVGA
jgi:hypothetical protein